MASAGGLKTRLLILIVIVLIIAGVGIIFLKIRHDSLPPVPSAALVTNAPTIQSIPGVGVTTTAYVRDVEQQNVEQAQQAEKTGKSAVPTLVRATYEGPSDFADVNGQPHTGCDAVSLRRARDAGVKASELRCTGCTPAELCAVGYTAGDLMDAGFSAVQLKASQCFSPTGLRNAGLNASELRRAGYSCQDLQQAGFSAKELQQAGYTADELKTCISSSALATVLARPVGNMPKDCSVSELRKAQQAGVSIQAIRDQLGCSAQEFKQAGYSAEALRKAGFTAGELKQAGYSADELKAAGFSAQQLRDAGFGAQPLKSANFSADDLKAAGFSQGSLQRAGFPAEVKTKVIVQPMTASATPQQPMMPATNNAPGPQGAAEITAPTEMGGGQEKTNQFLAELRAQQAQQLAREQRAESLTQLSQAMKMQASDLIRSWTPGPTPQLVIGDNRKDAEAARALLATAAAGGNGNTSAASLADVGPTVTYKAGSILMAVLDTGIDSDEQSPIYATVVSGPLKGAKVIGRFARVDQKVVLSFNRLSVPQATNSIEINAVAIDPNTARTALASNVDNHYMLRYGTLFASAFLSGLGQAVSQGGQQVVPTNGGAVTILKSLSPAESVIAAMGNVGTQLGTELGNVFNTPPTVSVNAGSGIGILFMQDQAVPSTGLAQDNPVARGSIGLSQPRASAAY